MNNLTFAYKDEAFTDSTILAEGAGVEHRAVIQLISNHKDDLEEFGRVTFEMPCDSVYDTLVEIFSAFSLDRQEKIRTICQHMKAAGIKKD